MYHSSSNLLPGQVRHERHDTGMATASRAQLVNASAVSASVHTCTLFLFFCALCGHLLVVRFKMLVDRVFPGCWSGAPIPSTRRILLLSSLPTRRRTVRRWPAGEWLPSLVWNRHKGMMSLFSQGEREINLLSLLHPYLDYYRWWVFSHIFLFCFLSILHFFMIWFITIFKNMTHNFVY
jgi:hypothetical protein